MSDFQNSLALGIVIERRPPTHDRAGEAWQPIAVLPVTGETRRLRDDGQNEQFLLASADMVLHRSDAASYRYNLAGDRPALFVVLRRDDRLQPVPWQVLLVTAAPDEAQKLMDSGEYLIEALPMPDTVRAWVEAFTTTCPPEEPFEKRQRKNWRDGGRR